MTPARIAVVQTRLTLDTCARRVIKPVWTDIVAARPDGTRAEFTPHQARPAGFSVSLPLSRTRVNVPSTRRGMQTGDQVHSPPWDHDGSCATVAELQF